MTDQTDNRVLYALFCMSRATLPIDTAGLADSAGLSIVAAGEALVRLERAEYVDASRARLTMRGLAKAVSLKADLGGTAPMVAVRGSQPAQSNALPAAAQSEVEDGLGR